jgi:hypothetical protein
MQSGDAPANWVTLNVGLCLHAPSKLLERQTKEPERDTLDAANRVLHDLFTTERITDGGT